MDATKDRPAAVRRQYERWPYPRIPLLAAVPSTHPWQLHCDYLWDRCGSGRAPERARLWIAGCGTFQPYVFALANPHAEIVATDLSERSLAIARRRCRLHGRRNVTFAPCDLNDRSSWPLGPFDLIECYGVLMNLPDPLATLRALGERLSPGGVLRLMVYPQFSRARIFQLQRLARLCGLHAGERDHPARFRALARALPKDHPLRHAFVGYPDGRTDAGLVDGFLHAGDRGFTGVQLAALVSAAGLEPAFWFHRQWAQPEVMAERLRLQDRSQGFVLAYLDLWQELRQNFVVCLRQKDAPPRARGPERAHPSFAAGGSLRHALALARLRLLGGRVPTRTGDGRVVLRPAVARALGHDGARLSATERERLQAEGLLLGGPLPDGTLAAHSDGDAGDWSAPALRIGRRAPNPLYAHLFAAWELAQARPDLGLPDLELQVARWSPWAEPLERRPLHFGLTPYGTYTKYRRNVQDHLAATPLPTAAGFGCVRLRDDAAALLQARTWLREQDLPRASWSDAELRELWSLRFGHQSLFLPLE